MYDDPLTLYKLIVLYMLNRASEPLTTAHIIDFVLGKDYTDFLTLQQVFHDLREADLIHSRTYRNRTQLSLTQEGRQTLHFFENRINNVIKDEINLFLKENEITLRNEISILGDYYKSTSGEYEAHLVAKEKGTNLVEITLSVPRQEIAESICDNWQKHNQEVYQALMKQLLV